MVETDGEHPSPSSLDVWRLRWSSARIPVIPLHPGEKRPVADAWQQVPPVAQWEQARAGGNIGALLSADVNGIIVADADNAAAEDNIAAGLVGLGLHPPTVRTASGGKHYYLRCGDVPAGFNWRRLSPEVGSGELRARRCYVVAPCSTVRGQEYAFVTGSPEAIAGQREVRWADVSAWLLAPPEQKRSAGGAPSLSPSGETASPLLEHPPVPLLRRDLPARALHLLGLLCGAPKGEPIDKYLTRSEAEAAVVAHAIVSGMDYGAIVDVFESWHPAHYVEQGKYQGAYLSQTYGRMLAKLAAHPERQAIVQAYQSISAAHFPGRGGPLERAVLLALLSVCWAAGAWVVDASIRDLSEVAAAAPSKVAEALHRLQVGGLVHRVVPASGNKAARWCVPFVEQLATKGDTHHSTNDGTNADGRAFLAAAASSSVLGAAAERTAASQTHGADARAASVRELWASPLLGRAAGAVWCALSGEPASVRAVAAAAGVERRTAQRALRRLGRYHLASGGKVGRVWLWQRGPADVADVARQLGADKAAAQRRQRHEREREQWQETLALLSQRKRDGQQTASLFGNEDAATLELARAVPEPVGVLARALPTEQAEDTTPPVQRLDAETWRKYKAEGWRQHLEWRARRAANATLPVPAPGGLGKT